MDTAEQIKTRIHAKREELEENLDNLERKVKDAADWRKQFHERPFAGLGLAFAAGLVAASMFGRGRERQPTYVLCRHR